MQTLKLRSWSAFKKRLQEMYGDVSRLRSEKLPASVSEPVFRGQADAAWRLSTTLEREQGENIPFEFYHRSILHPSLRMLKGIMDFELPDLPDLKLSIRDMDVKFPLYDHLAMLRHHGFPAPLLDWTLSPYVAAFFAFSPAPAPSAKNVAIFSYREHFGAGKGYAGNKAHIRSFGPWSPVHARHVRQQSQYTIALREQDSRIVFCPHDEAISERPFNWLRFDEITKFILPIGIREEVLLELRRMNITEYSLFDTADALVKTVSRFAHMRP